MSDFLLDELARVPASTLPADARAALTAAISSGAVDNVYQPVAADYWNVCLADVPPYVDPRVKLDQWVAWWRAGLDAAEQVIAAYTAQQDRIWQVERQRLQDGGQPR